MDVITIGSAIRDVFVAPEGDEVLTSAKFPTGEGLCLPLGAKLRIDHLDITLGGDALNTAVTFARRGFKTATIAKVGADATGKEIAERLAAEGVSTRFLLRDKKLQTAYSIILLADNGDRTVLTYGGATRNFGPADLPWQQLKPKWFFVTHLSEKSAAVFPRLLRHAKRVGAKIAVNPGKTQLTMPLSKIKPLLNMIDVFVVNREEASYLTRVPYAEEEKIFGRLDSWVKGLVVMTDGPKGVTVSDGTTRWKAGVLKERKIVDRTGAGDSFGSGFVAGLIEAGGGLSPRARRGGTVPPEHAPEAIRHAIQVGSANATSVVETIGGNAGALRKDQSIYKWGRLAIKEQGIGYRG